MKRLTAPLSVRSIRERFSPSPEQSTELRYKWYLLRQTYIIYPVCPLHYDNRACDGGLRSPMLLIKYPVLPDSIRAHSGICRWTHKLRQSGTSRYIPETSPVPVEPDAKETANPPENRTDPKHAPVLS